MCRQIGLLILLVTVGACKTPEPVRFRIATFQADVTPPIGHPLLGGPWKRATRVRDPLSSLGFVILGPERPIVFATVDWCEIRGESYDRWRRALADAAGTDPTRVLLSSVHQHDAPLADRRAQELLTEHGLPGVLSDPVFHESAIRRVANALRTSLPGATEITHVASGQSKVDDIASNRRVVREDGGIDFSRYSFTRDPGTRAAPEGVIDPWLKSLVLFSHDVPRVVLHVYACHPMSNYGSGEVTGDFVNDAREPGRHGPQTLEIYASGASGDVTGGKFNDGTKQTRSRFADRLQRGMIGSWQQKRRRTLAGVELRVAQLRLPPRDDERFNRQLLEKRLAAANASLGVRIQAALGLSWLERVEAGFVIDVPVVDFGDTALLLLPAESFVAYQLAAQAMRPDDSIIVVGYGECGPGYIPTDRTREEGFVEEHGWCGISPGVEEAMLDAIREVLLPSGETDHRDPGAPNDGPHAR